MSNFYIHIGTPRTGTTVMQKHLFPMARNKVVFQKEPYGTTGNRLGVGDNSGVLVGASLEDSLEYIRNTKTPIEPKDSTRFLNTAIVPMLVGCAKDPKTNGNIIKRTSQGLDKALAKLKMTSQDAGKDILISTERLCNSGASVLGNSIHQTDVEYWIFPLCRRLQVSQVVSPLVIVCLRDPIPHLRSRYIRMCFNRRQARLRHLSAREYIAKQVDLERSHPGTSALTPSMHSEFIKLLQRHAYLKAFGFQELLASDDVFSLMGLEGEDRVAFRSFPRENRLPITREQEKGIESEITSTLKELDFHRRIAATQMFE